MLRTKKLYTYQDYAKLPDEHRYELIWGELLMTPSPDIPHQALSRELEKIIFDHVEKNDLGSVYYAPTDVVLDSHNTVQPDLVFVSKARRKIVTEKNIQGAPDLVVEITSPGTDERDRLVKRRLYEEHKVREFWLVDRDAKQVVVHVLKGDKYEARVFEEGDHVTSSLLSGLRVEVTRLFKIRR